MTDHPLALPPGTVLGGTAPDGRAVTYVHAVAPDDVLAADGVLTGDDELIAAVRATLDGSDEHIDTYDGTVFLHSLTEGHPLGHPVVPTMRWFLWRDCDNLPDMALSIAAVLPAGSVVNRELDRYLSAVQDYHDLMALIDGGC